MHAQPVLNEKEWRLVVELLEHERSGLRPEIRHTKNIQVREDLRDRLRTVEDLTHRLLEQGAVA